MRRKIQIGLTFDDDAQFAQQVAELAEALVQINVWELQHDGERLPCCLECGGVRYVPPQACDLPTVGQLTSAEPIRSKKGRPSRLRKYGNKRVRVPMVVRDDPCQSILDARGVYATRRGTCLDLACERAARRRIEGVPAVVVVEQRTELGQPLLGQFHAVVETPDGIEDPSAELQGARRGSFSGEPYVDRRAIPVPPRSGCGCEQKGTQG